MFGKLKNKVAIVTGCAQGIGQAIALLLASYKINIIANDLSQQVRLLVKEILKNGDKAVAVSGDIADEDTAQKLKQTAIETFGGVDFLVNNAGIHQHLTLEELSIKDWNRIIDVNLKGTFICSKAVIPLMKRQRYGRIVNISSIDGFTGTDHEAHYGASKSGIVGLTKCIALELSPYNATANAIAPGDILTDMLMPMDETRKKTIEDAIPLGRLGQPQDIAKVVLFLISDMADFITGQTIHVNGGSLMI